MSSLLERERPIQAAPQAQGFLGRLKGLFDNSTTQAKYAPLGSGSDGSAVALKGA